MTTKEKDRIFDSLGLQASLAGASSGGKWFAGSGDFPYFGTTDIAIGTNEYNPVIGKRDQFRPGNLNDPNEEHRWHFWSLHPGGGNWLMGDASVQFIAYSTEPAVMQALATRRNGEVFSPPY